MATQEALAAAATIGRGFATPLLAAVLSWDADQTERALTPARIAGLIVATEEGWAFSHELVREATYDAAAGERRRLHATTARALEHAAGPTESFERLTALAYHWRRAEAPVEAAAAAFAASAAAKAMHASAEAFRYAQDGWALQSPTAVDGARLNAALVYADAALTAGAYAEAESALRSVLNASAAPGDAQLQGRIWAGLGKSARRREAPAEAAGCFHRALDLLERSGSDSIELAETLIQLGELEAMTRARYEEADALCQRALAVAGRLAAPVLEASAALALANTRDRSIGPTAGRPLLQLALERALAGDDLALAAGACAALSNSLYWCGELREAARYATRRLELAERAGDLFQLRHAHSWLALLAFSGGAWAEARRLIGRAEPLLARLQNPEPIAFLRIVEALVEYYAGDLERAYALSTEAVVLFDRVDPATVVWYGGVPALVCIALGRGDEAQTWLTAQEQRLANLPESALPARSARNLLALAYAARADRERGAVCERALRPFAADYHWSQVRRSLAGLAALRGDDEQALADLDQAEQQARREGLQPELALLLLDRAALLDPTDARRSPVLAEATALAAALSMPGALARAAKLAAAPPAIARPTGLSRREVEVLRLVSSGKTNREIAAALVLSERTVINHLSHIFDKIGVSNRAGAAAFAFRHQLAPDPE